MSGSKKARSLVAIAGGLAVAAMLGGCTHGASSVLSTPGLNSQQRLGSQKALPHSGVTFGGEIDGNTAELCGPVAANQMRCLSSIRLDTPTLPEMASPDVIFGYHPADLVSAYKLPSKTRGGGQTIGIVDAFDDPRAGHDFDRYRAVFGLPGCHRINGCYKKVNQDGVEGGYPSPDTKWAGEISLDLDMASAICPNCRILLVEANSNSTSDLAAALDTAVRLGANVLSNSYGGTDSSYDNHYNHPGRIIVASSGDHGFAGGTAYPSASRFVVAVGGTSLVTASNNRGWTESAWKHAGSGCTWEPKPSWQHDTLCFFTKTVADVSAVADPNTGVAMYDSYNEPGWLVGGGTSAASPIIAGVYALAANENHLHYARGLYVFHNRLFDVVHGNNGQCAPAPLCQAGPGYDGPTGNGTPNGIGAF